MPLQIRRGTQAERDALVASEIPLAAGEPLWTTDEGNLYVGDGTTPGGVIVNITADVDLASYIGSIGEIEKDPIGDPGAKSPFITLDGTTVVIDLDKQISTNITPNNNEIYNLGENDLRFRQLYLSSAGIAMGEASITSSGMTVDLPAGSTVGGVEISTYTGGGETGGGIEPGGIYNISISGDDSTIIVDASTGVVKGTFVGDVYAEDETVMYDSLNKEISADSITLGSKITIDGTSITTTDSSNSVIFRRASIDLYSNVDDIISGVNITGVTNGTKTTGLLSLFGSRNTTEEPTVLSNTDNYTGIFFLGNNGNDYVGGAFISCSVDGNLTPGDLSIPSKLTITVADGTGSIYTNNKSMSFDNQGVLSAPIIKASSYVTSSLPAAPSEGWIVFDSTTKEFKGWNGTTWVVLG